MWFKTTKSRWKSPTNFNDLNYVLTLYNREISYTGYHAIEDMLLFFSWYLSNFSYLCIADTSLVRLLLLKKASLDVEEDMRNGIRMKGKTPNKKYNMLM